MRIEVSREKTSVYRRKSFALLQNRKQIGFLLPGESKVFEVDPSFDIIIKIDALTGGKIEKSSLLEGRRFILRMNTTFAKSPMIWSSLIVASILLPGIFDSINQQGATFLLIAVLLSYLPLLTFFRYKWLKAQPVS